MRISNGLELRLSYNISCIHMEVDEQRSYREQVVVAVESNGWYNYE